jgi:hypothetical protein
MKDKMPVAGIIKTELAYQKPDFGTSTDDLKPRQDEHEENEMVNPSIHLCSPHIPADVEPGHKVVLHGVVKHVTHTLNDKDKKDRFHPEEEHSMGVEIHHMEHHPEHKEKGSGKPKEKEEDAIERGLKEAEE